MSTHRISWRRVPWQWAVLATLCVGTFGCGPSTPTFEPALLADREKVVSALPAGITMETAVLPSPLYGQSSKTVEDALKYLAANVRENLLYDGIGHRIEFDTGAKDKAKTIKKQPGGPKTISIMIAPRS
jgi:hypothetical protein